MDINIKIKPTVLRASTKALLLAKITRGHSLTCSRIGWYYSPVGRGQDNGKVRVYTMQKFKRKVKRVPWGKKEVKGSTHLKSVLVHNGFWEAHVYDIPAAVFDLVKGEVKQGNRTFTFKKA